MFCYTFANANKGKNVPWKKNNEIFCRKGKIIVTLQSCFVAFVRSDIWKIEIKYADVAQLARAADL